MPDELQAMFQQMWDHAYGGIKSFVEADIASGKVTAALPGPGVVAAWPPSAADC